MRSEISPAGELAWQPGQRIDECESSRQQFQRTREIIQACTRRQSRIHIIVDDRRAECGHVHAQLVLATGDRLLPVMPGTRAALDYVDERLAAGLAIDLAHADDRPATDEPLAVD